MPKPTFFNLPDDKRALIRTLAIEEFARYPFAQASISRIVARAGISKGSIYQYFDDKFDLYVWLIEEIAREKTAFVATDRASHGGFFERLEVSCRAALRFMREHPRMGRLGARIHEPATDPRVRDYHDTLKQRGHAMLCALIQDAQDHHELRPDMDPQLAAHILANVAQAGLIDLFVARLEVPMHQYMSDPSLQARISDEDLDTLIHGMLRILRDGLGHREEHAS
ncbi:MAG: TetR/AcrR family transcriptional regulator [Myxococcota bacterium]